MERPHVLLVILAFGLGACEVADLPPLRADATRPDTTDTTSTDTRVAETVETETVEADTLTPDVADDATTDTSEVAASCVATTIAATIDASPHIETCSEVSYSTNPPTSGPHYPIWAQFKTYTSPVPRGFYVHNLEHGGVVIAYDCPSGCADELAAIATMVAALPADPLCALGVDRRVVVTPDPLLETRFAVIAWGASLVADCFDPEAVTTFIDAHYALGPEDTCSDGVDVTVPDLGTYCPPVEP